MASGGIPISSETPVKPLPYNTFNIQKSQFVHQTIYENQKCVDNEVEHLSADLTFNFTPYNGPSLSSHATKRLMNIIEIKKSKTSSQNKSLQKQYSFQTQDRLTSYTNQAYNLIQSIIYDTKQTNDENFIVNLNGKFGITYFFGKSINWNEPVKFVDLADFLQGIRRPENFTKNASLYSCFNSNKSIENINKFVQKLSRRGYKYTGQVKLYSLVLSSKKNANVINICLNENFEILSISDEKSKIWKIDFLRDRTLSMYKLTGTYLDIFDIRIQVVKFKEKLENLKEIETQWNINGKLLSRSDDMEKLILNENIDSKVQYLREVTTKTYELPILKGDSPSDFALNFKVKIEDIIEYTKAPRVYSEENKKIFQENIYRKILIGNSTVGCSFNIKNWVKTNFDSSSSESGSVDTKIFSMTQCLCKELLYLSDEASISSREDQIEREIDARRSPWFSSMKFLQQKSKSPLNGDGLNYLLNGKLINYERLALIKRINYSRNYLEIFGVNIDSENLNKILDNEIKSEYTRMLKAIMGDDYDDASKLMAMRAKNCRATADGLIKIAAKKLTDAFEILHDLQKREPFLKKLRKSLLKEPLQNPE